MHIKLSGTDVVAIRHDGANTPSADQIRTLVEASTDRRPAYLPGRDFQQDRVYLAEQRSWVDIPSGHWLVALPSGAVIVLSSTALDSIRA